MSLRWKSFEKKLRPRVRAEIRASELLRREQRQIRNLWRRHFRIPAWVLRPFIFMVAGMAMFNAADSVAKIAAFIWLWALAAALLRAFQWGNALYQAPELNLFQHLPISDERIFQVQSHRVAWKSLWSAADFSVLYALLLYRAGGGWNSIGYGAVLGVVQWLFVISLAGVLFAWEPRRIAGLLMLFFGGAAIAVFWITKPSLLHSINTVAHWIPPLGWLPQAAGDNFSSGLSRHLPPTVVWAVVLAAFPVAWRNIRRAYVLSETDFSAARHQAQTAEATAATSQQVRELFTETDETVKTMVRGGMLKTEFNWSQAGLVERIVARLLTARQRVVAEFLVAANPGWTKKLRTALVITVAGVVVVRLLLGQAKFDPMFAIMMGAYFVLIQTFGHWHGFATLSPAGIQPPCYAFYPVTFRDLFLTMLKINTIRCALLLPLVAALVFLLGGKMHSAFEASTWWRLGVICFLIQPVLALAPISTATNDSSRWSFMLPAFAYIIVMIGLGIAFMFLQQPSRAMVAGLALAGLMVLAVWLYARRFNRNQFDLMPNPAARS